MTGKAAIVGIAETAFAKSLEPTEYELACQVIIGACKDAGVDPGDVDAMTSFSLEKTDSVTVARAVGAGELTFFAQFDYGGGAGAACVGALAMAIETGQCQVGVAWRARKRGARTSRPWAGGVRSANGFRVGEQFGRPYGLIRPVDEVAVLTRRYMHEHGATRDHLANVALACRRHANANPAAMMCDRPLDRDTYMSSRWISEPLCLYDNCLESDGAVAVVMTTEERARDLRQVPAIVESYAQGMPAGMVGMTNYHNADPLRGPSWTCAKTLWGKTDLRPKDVDSAQFYDAFSPLILLSLEGYGFCGRGEAGPFSDDGALEIGGRLPVNTSGGGLSEAYVHGFNLISEGVRQIRGTSTNQVPGGDVCLVTAAEAVPTSAVLLRR